MSELIATKIKLKRKLPAVLGVGAYLKNALCLIQDDEAWISRPNDSLDSVAAIERFEQTASEMIATARMAPVAVAHDWHPDFFCTRWAKELGMPAHGVQHHHAHIAALMAEHQIEEPVLGLALDGFGLGENNQSWGGELLRVDAKGFERLGWLYPLPQPGGDRAAREPWRMGAAALWSLGKGEEISSLYNDFEGAKHLSMMIEKGLNAPMTSSAGRLFDAACGLLNVMPIASFEGEAPMKLESLVTETVVDQEGWKVEGSVLDMRPMMARLIGMKAEEGANLFHGTLAAALHDWVFRASDQTGIKNIALGGGCFFNKVLCRELDRSLRKAGLEPFWAKQVLPGDTAIALGQAYAVSQIMG